MFKVLNIRHTGVVVQDLEEALTFYKDALGFIELRRSELDTYAMHRLLRLCGPLTWVKLQIKDTDDIIELYYFHTATYRYRNDTPHHIALTVDNIKEMFKKMRYLKLNISSEIIQTETANLFFGQDPSGNIIEFVEEL